MHGDLAAAQRLWCMALAAAERRFYTDLVPDERDTMSVLNAVANRLRATIVERLTPPEEAREAPKEPPTRFLFCLDYLPPSTRLCSHLHQVCCYATAMSSLPGAEAVLTMATGETMPEGIPFLRQEAESNIAPEAGWRLALSRVAEPEVARKVHFFYSEAKGRVRPIEQAVDVALRFRPDVIIYFLGMLRSRLMPRLLRNVAPQVAIQFNVLNEEPTDCDLVLSQGAAIDFRVKPTPEIWASHAIPVLPLQSEGEAEAQPSLPRARFKIVTALSDGRIERVLTEQDGLATRIREFLEANPDVAWVFIGVDQPARILERRRDWWPLIDCERISLIGFAARLREVFAQCSIYVHLPGMGGGGMGIAMAIAEGLPALVEIGTDATNFVNGEAVYDNVDDAFSLIGSLMRRDDKRIALAKQQAQVLEGGHSIAAVRRDLETILPKAVSRFMQR